MEVSMADFMELTIDEVSDLLMDKLHESGNDETGALLRGVDDDGRIYSLKVVLSYDSD